MENDTHEGARPASSSLALTAIALVAAQAILGPREPLVHDVLVALAVIVALVSFAFALPAARSVAALGAIASVVSLTAWLWQIEMLLIVGGLVALGRVVPTIAPAPTWRARGSLPVAGTLFVAGVTPVALTGWVIVMKPDLSDVIALYHLRDYPFAVLLAGALGFALANAALEEAIWRGLLQDRLTFLLGAPLAIVLQGASFGLQHWYGVPRGPVGAVLAGSWGVMLGMLRHRAGGLAAPLIAHVVADATIATILLVHYL